MSDQRLLFTQLIGMKAVYFSAFGSFDAVSVNRSMAISTVLRACFTEFLALS